MDKYVIVDIHPADSFYDKREHFIGKVITFPGQVRKFEMLDEHWGGQVVFETPFYMDGEKFITTYFLGILVEPVQESSS